MPLPTDTPTAIPTATDTATATATATATDIPTSTPTATAAATVAPAATLTFTPIADAYVNAGSPNSKYGTATVLRVDGSPDVRSYLRFSVQGITAPVTRATLLVYATSGTGTAYNVYTASGSWTETTITYNNAPAIGGLGWLIQCADWAGSWTSVDVTNLVGGNSVVDLVMTTTDATAVAFSSRESSNPANPPQLVVEFGGSGAGAAINAAAVAAAPVELDLPPATQDSDGDGAPDAVEILNGSNPNVADTDGDGLLDLWEIESGLSPTDPTGS